MLVLPITGALVTASGLMLIVVGALLAWKEHEATRKRRTKGLAKDIDALAGFADALAKHPVCVRLIFIGVLLVVIGAIISGVGGFIN